MLLGQEAEQSHGLAQPEGPGLRLERRALLALAGDQHAHTGHAFAQRGGRRDQPVDPGAFHESAHREHRRDARLPPERPARLVAGRQRVEA